MKKEKSKAKIVKMNKQSVTFYAADIRNRHPHGVGPWISDDDYVVIANHLVQIIDEILPGEMKKEWTRAVALNVTLWFEDIVSEVGIWRSFIKKNQELYYTYLPFYPLEEDYQPDEPHLSDIRFIIWKSMSDEKSNVIINPENPGNLMVAERFYDYLSGIFEETAINEVLVDYFEQADFCNDFYLMRDVLKWYYFDCYLTNGRLQDMYLDEEETDVYNMGINTTDTFYQAECNVVFNKKIGPLALYPQEWLEMLLREVGQAEKAEAVKNVKNIFPAVCNLVRKDEKVVVLEDYGGATITLQRGKDYEMSDKTLDNNNQCVGSFTLYDDKWYLNGDTCWLNAPDIFSKLDEDKERDKELGIPNYDHLMELSGGSPLFYFKNYKALTSFIKKEIGLEDFNVAVDKSDTNLVLFVPAKDKPFCMIPSLASVICDKRNPFYNKETAQTEGINALANVDYVPGELTSYLIQNNFILDAALKSTLGYEHGRKLLQDNIDFFARALRKDDYIVWE